MQTIDVTRASGPAPLRGACPTCGFLQWCRPANLDFREVAEVNAHIVHGCAVPRDEHLYRAGSHLTSLGVVKSGFLKTFTIDRSGLGQVTGFNMGGELVGLDGIGTGLHQCDTIAVEDSRVCTIDFDDFEELIHDIPALQRHFHQAMAGEIARDHGVMLLLGAMCVDERVANFLLNISRRFAARGYPATRFRLPMQRREIASYLGLKTETISRALGKLCDLSLIAVDGKEIEILDHAGLQATVGH